MTEHLESPQLRPVEAFPARVEDRDVICLRDPSGVTDAVLTVPRGLVPILALFDGIRSLVDVQAEIMRQCGELVLRSQLESMVDVLDQHLFLEGPRVDAERARQRATFLGSPVRPAFLAGRSYDGEPDGLAAALEGHFDAPGGPGAIGPRRDVVARGLVAPHIDFNRGGPAYAWAYRALAEAGDVDCFIVVGTAHAGLDGYPFAATAKPFETPFGRLEVDREVLDAVVRRAPGDLFAAELAHRGEHSVEFQAVWLQYLRRRAGGGERRFVPLLASFVQECLVDGRSPAGEPAIEAMLDALRDAMATVPRRYCLVAGADLAHVGPRFGDEWRAGPAELARVQAEDHALLAPVVRADAEGFFAEALRQRDRNRICGLSPIYAVLRLLSGGAGRLLHYGQWPDPEGAVSFASVSFEEEAIPR
ncbi:MAG TPA: AmmeMemoRadiSam system protein B [Methylomirabilota bacterium]|jgi:AmmeMemoRadiSam system protein B